MPPFESSPYYTFIKWMPFHIPILSLMYTFILMKLINSTQLIEIKFDYLNKKIILRIISLIILYILTVIMIIWMYKKVLMLKIQVLKYSGKQKMKDYEKHVKENTEKQLKKLEENKQFQEWKMVNHKRKQHEAIKIVYEMIESESSDEEIEKVNVHKLATSKKLF